MGMAPDQQHQHLREAVEHLRAAGLPDLAERVGREAKTRLSERQPPRSPVEAERLEQQQRQLEELGRAVERLQDQVARLSKDRK